MKKKLLALGLCLCLLAGLVPAALGASVYDAGSGVFPEFDSTMGYYFIANGEKTPVKVGMVPTRNYTTRDQSDISAEQVAVMGEQYMDLLVGTGNFVVDRAWKKSGNSDEKSATWSGTLKYTGDVAMDNTLGALYSKPHDPDAYHVKVDADYDSGRNPGKRCAVKVYWDAALTPVATDLRTALGETLGVEEDSSVAGENRPEVDPDDNSWMPKVEEPVKPGESWNGYEDPVEEQVRQPGDVYTEPEEDPDFTVVLAIGYNKMTVGREVTQVDDQNADVFPIAYNNRTLVPVSRIVDAFGGASSWDPKTNNTTYTLGKLRVDHVIGSDAVTITRGSQRQSLTMEAPSVAFNNRTYVPVRYVLEGLGLWVGYEPTYQLVVVSTKDLTGENLIKLTESQRLFNSEEVPEVPRHTIEHYTIDNFNYTMEVGEAMTLFNSYPSSATYYAYTWDVLDGGELVQVDRNSATCKFYAKRPGVVTIQSHVDETWVLGLGSFRNNTRTYTMTITITPTTESGSSGGLMTWQTCDFCGGSGTMTVGGRTITCTKCLGQKKILQ